MQRRGCKGGAVLRSRDHSLRPLGQINTILTPILNIQSVFAVASGCDFHDLTLYTTVEPCSKRLSGNLPCVERVLRLAASIKTVYVGIMEPETFVAGNTGKKSLQDAGISVVHVPGLEAEIMEVATAGHSKD